MRIYIHIPFCLKKCSYCDFLSFPEEKDIRSQYISALKKEIRSRLAPEKMTKETSLCHSVFFGGGTPTVLSGEELAGILDEIGECIVIDGDAEITCEANPCTLDREKAEILKEAGFNRISIGAQSMDDANLKMLGRIHNKETFYRAFEDARRAGFSNLNLDMIFGLPGQTVRRWEEELNEAAELGSEHISVYALELYEGTPLFRDRGKYSWPGDEELAVMYERTGEILAEHGLYRYEISNYARPGYESRHNTGYWTGDEYLGFGIGAASYEKKTRYNNTGDIREYIEKMKNGTGASSIRTNLTLLSQEDMRTEYMILGLRLTKGVSVSGFEERFGEKMENIFGGIVDKYLNLGFMERDGDRIRLSEKALFVSNSILAEFTG